MKTKINVNNEKGRVNAISTFHPVEGRWVKIEQIFNEDGSVIYYTDGTRVEKPEENPPMDE